MSKQPYRLSSLTVLLLLMCGCADESLVNGSSQRAAQGATCPKNPPPVVIPEISNPQDIANCLIVANLREAQLMGVMNLVERGCKVDVKSIKGQSDRYVARLSECADYQIKSGR